MTLKQQIPTFLEYFKEGFETHYWREATYHPNDGYLNNEYINRDIKASVEWYQVEYKVNVEEKEQKEAYNYIKEMINEREYN